MQARLKPGTIHVGVKFHTATLPGGRVALLILRMNLCENQSTLREYVGVLTFLLNPNRVKTHNPLFRRVWPGRHAPVPACRLASLMLLFHSF